MADMRAALIDSRWLEDSYLLRRVVQSPALKQAEPVVAPGQAYGSVLRLPEGGWRMYYLHSRFEKNPLHPHDSSKYITRLATSDDGMHWEKPSMGLVQVDGSKDNNAIMGQSYIDAAGNDLTGGSGPEGFCVLDARQTPVPHARGRFTCIYLASPNDRWGGICLAHSDDGIAWTAYPENPVIPGWHDTQTSMFYDAPNRQYVAYLRPPHYAGPHSANRKVARSISTDLATWSIPRVVLDTDDVDALGDDVRGPMEPPRGRDRQWYGLTAFPIHDLTVGLGWMYDEIAGKIWIELVHSYDGIDWRREALRPTFIGHGAPADFSGNMFCSMATPPITVGDELWFYVSATHRIHHKALVNPLPPPQIYLLALPRDRWVGYQSLGPRPGMLMSRPLPLERGQLAVNARIEEGGHIAVQFRDELNHPLTDLGLDEIATLQGPVDGLDLPVRFYRDSSKTHLRFPTRGPVRLHFTLHKATLFGWTIHGV